jgi:hypothetical protein
MRKRTAQRDTPAAGAESRPVAIEARSIDLLLKN